VAASSWPDSLDLDISEGKEEGRQAMRNDGDRAGRLPALSDRERPVDLVQEQQPVGRPGGQGDLRQPDGREPPPPRPGPAQ